MSGGIQQLRRFLLRLGALRRIRNTKRFLAESLQMEQHSGSVRSRTAAPCLISIQRYSQVYVAGVNANERAAIKCCLDAHGVSDAQTARRQYEAMQRVHAAFASAPSQYKVPEPLRLMPDLGAYSMSWIDGRSLTNVIQHNRGALDPHTALTASGGWLGTFHSLGPTRRQPPDLATRAQHLGRMRRTPIDHAMFRWATDHLASTLDSAAATVLSTSWLHGDCKPDNFMLSPPDVFGIDFAVEYENAVELDLAQFLNNFELLLRENPRQWHVDPQGMIKSFLAGYQSTGPAINKTFLQWIRLDSAITYWHQRVVDERPLAPRRWLLNRAFARLVQDLKHDIERQSTPSPSGS